MADKSVIRCPTERCASELARYGENYHGVYEKTDHLLCERCGGKSVDRGVTWTHDCVNCKANVQPGQLLGFFVPHRCKACDEKVIADDRARGHICRRCNQVFSYCCC